MNATDNEFPAEAQVAAWEALAGMWESTMSVEDEIAAIYAARTFGRDVHP
jgi:hypothetical protein